MGLTLIHAGPVLWQGRLCKILETGHWAFSRVNHFADFEYGSPDEDGAVTGNCTVDFKASAETKTKMERTARLCPVDDRRLLLVQESGDVFMLVGTSPKDWRIVEVDLGAAECWSQPGTFCGKPITWEKP